MKRDQSSSPLRISDSELTRCHGRFPRSPACPYTANHQQPQLSFSAYSDSFKIIRNTEDHLCLSNSCRKKISN
ncbi:Phosphatase and actin regulator 4 [Clarias magur]|uniref:Phosphatase and actin regulator 4 n=1 Tax=Clarias magur TaxID=1594786 RepID=A0A8J4U3M7_CLAMG|nr:Phosphatase and actin regulator 4 [Clarias magur]